MVNVLCFFNISLGVNIVMGMTYLFVRPFSAATVRRLVSVWEIKPLRVAIEFFFGWPLRFAVEVTVGVC